MAATLQGEPTGGIEPPADFRAACQSGDVRLWALSAVRPAVCRVLRNVDLDHRRVTAPRKLALATFSTQREPSDVGAAGVQGFFPGDRLAPQGVGQVQTV